MNSSYDELKALLGRRLEIISDHAWRDRDASAHLEALKAVSEELQQEHGRLVAGDGLPVRLEHFLANCSYDKALAFIEAQAQAETGTK